MTEPLALADVQVTPGSWERYRYNIRFSVDQLARGVPQDIHRAQGQSGVWYGGGSLSHWNVGDILEQASQTVARMAAAHGSEWTHQTVAKVASRSRVAVALSGAWGDAPGAAPRAFFGWSPPCWWSGCRETRRPRSWRRCRRTSWAMAAWWASG